MGINTKPIIKRRHELVAGNKGNLAQATPCPGSKKFCPPPPTPHERLRAQVWPQVLLIGICFWQRAVGVCAPDDTTSTCPPDNTSARVRAKGQEGWPGFESRPWVSNPTPINGRPPLHEFTWGLPVLALPVKLTSSIGFTSKVNGKASTCGA